MQAKSRLTRLAPSIQAELTERASYALLEGTEAWWAIQSDWRRLLDEQPNASPFWHWEYVNLWRDRFALRCPESGSRFDYYTVVVSQHGAPIAIFPLFTESTSPTSLRTRRLRLLGFSGASGPADMTEEPIHLIKPGHEVHAWEGLQKALHELGSRSAFDLIDLRLWDQTPGRTNLTLSHRAKTGPSIVQLPDTWADYKRSLSKSMRDNFAYYPNLLRRRGHMFDVSIASDPGGIRQGVEELVRLHRLRATASSDPRRVNHFPTATQVEFQQSVLPGRGFVATLAVDGRTVAAQAFIESDQTILVGYSGFDPEWAAFSPLLVLQAEVIRGAMERGVRRIDFQRGNKSWQARWGAQPSGQIYASTIVRKAPVHSQMRHLLCRPRIKGSLKTTAAQEMVESIERSDVSTLRRRPSKIATWMAHSCHTNNADCISPRADALVAATPLVDYNHFDVWYQSSFRAFLEQ